MDRIEEKKIAALKQGVNRFLEIDEIGRKAFNFLFDASLGFTCSVAVTFPATAKQLVYNIREGLNRLNQYPLSLDLFLQAMGVEGKIEVIEGEYVAVSEGIQVVNKYSGVFTLCFLKDNTPPQLCYLFDEVFETSLRKLPINFLV